MREGVELLRMQSPPEAEMSSTTKLRPEDQLEAEPPPIPRPATVDPGWDVKIQRAREAWAAGRRLRKDQPAVPSGLFSP